MRIRSILPDFYRSEDVAAMDWHTRLVFIGLWSYVDDNGVGRDNTRLITSDLFPLDGDPTETLRRVSTALLWLSEHGQIRRYKVSGVPYLFVIKWDKYQRVQNAAKERYPRPTSDNVEPPDVLPTSSGDSPETLSPGEGEKGRRGEVLLSESSDDNDRFDEFWDHYPKKEAKADARKAWKQITKKHDPQSVIDVLTAYAFNPDRQFQPLPASWLRGERWKDEKPTGLHLVGERRLTADEIINAIGPDRWTCPTPPAGLDADQEWEWRRQRQIEHIEERQRQARERLAVRA